MKTRFSVNNSRSVALLLGGLVALSAPAATASAQTVEGANTFLARVAEQGASRIYRDWPYIWYGRNMAGQNCDGGCNYTTSRPVRFTSATSTGQCVTVLGHDAPAGYQEGDFWKSPTAYPASVTADWSRVTAVTRPDSTPSRVYLSGLDGRDGINGLFLEFDTPDLATRAAAAMEFLRTSCDSLSGTGF